MSCTGCGPSILGRNVIGRSIPGTDIRYRNGKPAYTGNVKQSLSAPIQRAEMNNGLIFVTAMVGLVAVSYLYKRYKK